MINEKNSIGKNITQDESIQWLDTEPVKPESKKRRRRAGKKSLEKRCIRFGIVLCVFV